MNTQQLDRAKPYVERQLARGYSLDVICHVLEKANYDPEVIKEIQQLYSKRPSEPHRKYVLLGAIFLLFLLLVYLFLPSSICETKECFVTRADQGKSAVYKEILFGSEVMYRHKNGLITMEFTAFGQDEPELVKDLLGKKNMTCPYSGIESIDLFYNLNSCQGTLKDALDELDALI
jgi:hypothetical protein